MSASLSDYIAAHRALFAHFEDLTRSLNDDQLATQSLCPDWTVKDVIAHTIGVEAALDGWVPSTEQPPPFGKVGELMAEAATLDRDTFADRIAAVTSSRLADLEQADADIVDVSSITPTGIGVYGRFLQVRVFDMWVHARDIAVPLGQTLDSSGFAAETALQEVADSVGYIVGKKIGLPDGKSIVFQIRGAVDRDIAVHVDGRATLVDAVESPDVTLTADVDTFVLLAAGRIDPQASIDDGSISWTGDAELGERAARNLAYTR